jgi:predicted phosphodiesterase
VAAGPVTDRIAIISDVHGNLTALEAVLAHIRESGISRVFNLGDLVGKGPRSAEAVDRCREACEVIVQGNWDAHIGIATETPARHWHREQLGPERLAWLAALPGSFDFALSGRRMRLFHASQVDVYTRVYPTSGPEKLRAMFSNTAFTGFGPAPDIVGYGDIHDAYSLTFENKMLFNAGSVGNPLDMPLACYAVLEGDYEGATPAPWSLHFVRLPYDIEGEIKVAEAAGMPDLAHYAKELRTATYRGRT